MLNSPVFIWVALLVLFLVAEGVTTALVSIWFAAGALAGLIACLLGAAMWLQVVIFLVVSLVLLAVLWKKVRAHSPAAKTNVDSIIGSQGYVVEPIDNQSYTGRVKLGGVTWAARSTSGSGIPADTLVRVDRVEGVKVFVSPVPVACEGQAK